MQAEPRRHLGSCRCSKKGAGEEREERGRRGGEKGGRKPEEL
jgi:hypothetical protein